MSQPIIQFREITKSFPGVRALDGINLTITRGSCHAIVGENGAGKSTLGKILAGIYQPDSGSLTISGQLAAFDSPRDAIRAGVGMVHQELLFCENLTVAENLCLGQLPSHLGVVKPDSMRQKAAECLAAIHADIDPSSVLGDLSVSRQQLVQIASAVARGADILVFDEPTSSLSGHETQYLFDLIEQLREQGVTIIYVSHRLEELFRITDTVTVMRDGRVVGTRPTSEVDHDGLVRMMIGRSLDDYYPGHLSKDVGEELLRVTQLSSPAGFDNISFSLHAGEVLGIAGLVGAGRTQVAEAIFGLDPDVRGDVHVRGKLLRPADTAEALREGLGMVPEDRKRHGLVFSLNARENISLPILDKFSSFGWVRTGAERKLAEHYFERLAVKAPGLDASSESLSGGNQQKLVIARWMAADCGILIVDEPTRGVDVGAKAEIHGLIDKLAASGAGVILISSDLPEILNLSTRILVMREGRIAAELPRGTDQETVLRAMAGLQKVIGQ